MYLSYVTKKIKNIIYLLINMKKNWTIKIPNPIFWLRGSHKCEFTNNLYDIPMENNTNFLITQCKCGKTNMVRAHRESEMYKEWVFTKLKIKYEKSIKKIK